MPPQWWIMQPMRLGPYRLNWSPASKLITTALSFTSPKPLVSDPVNHPEHYTVSTIECIDAIRAALTPEEWRGYIKGNAIKYCWRERYKGGEQDLDKAVWYLTHR